MDLKRIVIRAAAKGGVNVARIGIGKLAGWAAPRIGKFLEDRAHRHLVKGVHAHRSNELTANEIRQFNQARRRIESGVVCEECDIYFEESCSICSDCGQPIAPPDSEVIEFLLNREFPWIDPGTMTRRVAPKPASYPRAR